MNGCIRALGLVTAALTVLAGCGSGEAATSDGDAAHHATDTPPPRTPAAPAPEAALTEPSPRSGLTDPSGRPTTEDTPEQDAGDGAEGAQGGGSQGGGEPDTEGRDRTSRSEPPTGGDGPPLASLPVFPPDDGGGTTSDGNLDTFCDIVLTYDEPWARDFEDVCR